ncbi:MAG: hypothetical protein QOH31_214 [Verrucomicrobiota bacterium]
MIQSSLLAGLYCPINSRQTLYIWFNRGALSRSQAPFGFLLNINMGVPTVSCKRHISKTAVHVRATGNDRGGPVEAKTNFRRFNGLERKLTGPYYLRECCLVDFCTPQHVDQNEIIG